MGEEKRCTKCNETKNINDFGNLKLSKDGKFNICKACNRERNRLYRNKKTNKDSINIITPTQTTDNNLKTCTKCKTSKSLDNFGALKKSKDGKLTICKSCNNQRNNLYREKRKNKNVPVKENYSLEKQIKIFEKKTGLDFNKFYTTYFPKLVYYNTKYLKGDVHVAEDIAMEALMKSLEKIKDYDPDKARFSTWLFTISRNESIQILNKMNKVISMDQSMDQEGTTIKDFISDSSFEDNIENELKSLSTKKGELLEEKIEELKDPYKKVIELREIENKTYREITIILKQKEKISLTRDVFNKENYRRRILSLVDPEKKKPNELIKFCSIKKIINSKGENVDFQIMEYDKDGLISKIKLKSGDFEVYGEVPFNMSTLKSQIRNGRILLQSMVEKDFNILDSMYL